MTSEAANRPTGPGRYLFEDAPPPPPHLAALARPFVDRAVLKFRNFRVDLEKVQGVADGVGEVAATLALTHAERAMKSLRLDWKERRRGIPKKRPPETQEVMRGMQRPLIARIPLRNADMLLELGELVPYLAQGTGEERAALAALAEEVKADQERFPAA